MDAEVRKRTMSARPSVEWPTVVLAAFIYTGWGLLTFFHAVIPLWLLLPLGAWFVAWQTSLQHEIIHGHPTRNRTLNRVIGSLPLLLWLPFESYRISHLIHHRDERLTDPLDDPESHYWTPDQWASLSLAHRLIVQVNATFLGRITIGPAWSIYRFLKNEVETVLAGNVLHRRIWREHAWHVLGVLAWLVLVCGMNPLFYLAVFAYPATSLMLIRSFAEHRADSEVDERTAIVEDSPLFGLLFLYNNLHVVHHEEPMMPWYEIPAWYRANRERLIQENGGLVYSGYLDIARRFFVTPHDTPVHPLGRAP